MRHVCGVVAVAFCLAWLAAWSHAGEAVSARSVVEMSNHASLYQGRDCRGTTTMIITDKQGRTRKRQFNMLRLDCGARDGDQKYFVYFIEPSDVRKMVFMVHKHVGAEADDDRWLYMPSLDLVKRIAASDKRTSFVGSDFLYEDISGRNPSEDFHELIPADGPFHVVRGTPRNPGAVEFAAYVAHIDKTTWLPMRIEYHKADGRPYRIIEVLEVELVAAAEQGRPVAYPTVVRSVARDLETGSRTEMVFSDIRYNSGLEDALFTERYLRRAPREVLP